MLPVWTTIASVASADFAVAEVNVGGGAQAIATAGVRLGRSPGRPYTFLVDFGEAAASALHESNAPYSVDWAEPTPGALKDLVVSPTLVLQGTFAAAPAAGFSTLAFAELAHDHGAYICNGRVGVGDAAGHCVRGGKTVQVPCDADGCWTTVQVAGQSTTLARVQGGLLTPACAHRAKLAGRSVCVGSAAEVTRGNATVLAYDIAVGDTNPLLGWWRGTPGEGGELYLQPEPESALELAAWVAVAAVGFVLWCQQTADVTAYAVGASSPGVAPVPRLVCELSRREQAAPVAFFDIGSALAVTLTLLFVRYGTGLMHESTHLLLSAGFRQVLAVLGVAYVWLATAVLTIVLFVVPRWASTAYLNPSAVEKAAGGHRAAAAATVAARLSFETLCMISIHQTLPRAELGEFPDIIGLFFGLVILVIASRDVALVVATRERGIGLLLCIMWGMLYPYVCFVMLLPPIVQSTAVLAYHNTAIVFALTLGWQAAVAGLVDALRKLGRI